MEEYRRVMKSLNSGQTQELEKRYKNTAVFKSIQNVNDSIPFMLLEIFILNNGNQEIYAN